MDRPLNHKRAYLQAKHEYDIANEKLERLTDHLGAEEWPLVHEVRALLGVQALYEAMIDAECAMLVKMRLNLSALWPWDKTATNAFDNAMRFPDLRNAMAEQYAVNERI